MKQSESDRSEIKTLIILRSELKEENINEKKIG